MSKERLIEINEEYAKECTEIGHFIVNAMFNNEAMVKKYTKIKKLQTEAKQLASKMKEKDEPESK